MTRVTRTGLQLQCCVPVIPNGTKYSTKLLRETQVLETLTSVTTDELVRCATSYGVSKGQTLFTEGEAAVSVNIVLQGSFRSSCSHVDGREQVFCIEGTGAVLGGASIFTGGVHISSMVAEEQSMILCVEMHNMKRLCQSHPDLLWWVAAALAHSVRSYTGVAAMLSLRSVERRLALHLLTIGQDRGVQTDEGCRFELTATRSQIAARLGSVREVVSRSLTHLQERGLIKVRGRFITLKNVVALRQFGLGEMSSPFEETQTARRR